MLSKETGSLILQSVRAHAEYISSFKALSGLIQGDVVPQRDTHAYMLFQMFIPAYRQPECIRNTADVVVRSELQAQKADLIRFDDATLASLGQDTRDAMIMTLVNDMSCKEAMDKVSRVVTTSKTGKIVLPFDDLRDSYVEVYKAAKDICA